MAVLTAADAIRLGNTVIDRVYAYRTRVWWRKRYMDATVGYAYTPDTPDLQILGDVRWTARVRDDSAESGSARYIIIQGAGVDYAYSLGSTYLGYFYGSLGWPTGSTTPQYGLNFGPTSRAVFGLSPPGTDRYIGAELTGVQPTTQSNTLTARGLSSTDGITWTTTGTPSAAVRGDSLSRDSAAPLRITQTWLGRIYWAQMEAINRRSYMFPGLPGNMMSVPDTSALDVTGDIEIVARAAPTSWTVATIGTFVSKDGGAAATRSYMFRQGSNVLYFAISLDGTSVSQANSAALGFADGLPMWVKVTRVASTGAVAFYTAPDAATEPTSWTARGTGTTTAGNIYAGTALAMVGAYNAGGSTSPFAGRIQRVIVRNGIAGPAVLDVSEVNASSVAAGATSFTSGDTGNRSIYFPGTASGNNHLTVPTSAPFDITGDLTITWEVQLPPGPIAANGIIVMKGVSWAVNGLAYAVNSVASGNGYMQLYVDTPGGLLNFLSPTLPTSWLGTRRTYAVSLDVDDGAGGKVHEWLTSTDRGATWTVWARTTVAGTTTIKTIANPMLIGGRGSTATFLGNIARVTVRNGIGAPGTVGGSVVFNYDADTNLNGVDPAANSFALTTGGTASVSRGGTPALEIINGRSPVTVRQTASTAAFLNPSMGGAASSPDAPELPLAGDVVVTCKLRKPTLAASGVYAVCSHFGGSPQYGWALIWNAGQFQLQFSLTGTSAIFYGAFLGSVAETAAAFQPDTDFYIGFKMRTDDGTGRWRVQGIRSTDGVTWTNFGTETVSTAGQGFASTFDTNNPLRIGSYQSDVTATWDGRIYWAEHRLGQTPGAGTLVWRFNATEYPGSGTSFTDPRGRAWSLYNANTIAAAGTQPIIQALPDQLVWRFDANDRYGTGTTYTDPRGRVWTLSAAGAIP